MEEVYSYGTRLKEKRFLMQAEGKKTIVATGPNKSQMPGQR